MSKLDKEFKSEVKQEFKEADYVGVKVGFRIVIVFLVIAILGGFGGVIYTRTIGKAQTDAERDVFKNTVAYTEQCASFLAKEYNEYNDADNDKDRNTIMTYVIMRYPNVDTSNIDNQTLKQFYTKCLNN